MTNYTVARANMVVFAVLIAVVLVVSGTTWDRFSALRSARSWSAHSYAVLQAIDGLELALRDAETGQRGFLLTDEDTYLEPYQAALGQVSFLEGELQRLTADEPDEQVRLRALAPSLQRKLEELAQTIQLRRSLGLDAALRIVRSDVGRNLTLHIEAVLDAMTDDERARLDRQLAESDSRGVWVRVLVAAGTLISLLSLVGAARMLNGAWSRSQRAEAEQRRIAQRLRSSLDSLSQGVAVFGADNRLINWNECFRNLLAIPRAMLRAGAPYAAFVEQAAENGPLLETEDQIRHSTRPSGDIITFERARTDGRLLEIRRTSMPDGGFVLTISDMTKRAQAEGVLREVQKMQAIGQLTGGIAHDFNNLLTVILGNLELARGKLAGDTALGTRIERAVWAAQRGATLTSQLLAFARRQPLAPGPIDFAASMPDLLPLLRRTLGEHIEIRFVDTAGLWPAMADAAQLENAVLNLALNARDAMPGGGRLTIEIANKVLDEDYASHHAEVTAGDYVMLAVSDTGHGMTPDVLERVFEPFFTTKPDGRGTGLGLAMVFGFVKQSGGHVSLYSEPDQGTTVRLYLPRATASPTQAVTRIGGPIDLPRGSATILVVEDEPAVREVAVAILTDLGYGVLQASDGDEGLLVFGAHAGEIDLLLTDVVLPGSLRGRDLADRITAVRPSVRVLFMSGYTENAIVHGGRLDDGVQLISKPFKREQLARRVADLLGAPLSGDGTVVELKPRRTT